MCWLCGPWQALQTFFHQLALAEAAAQSGQASELAVPKLPAELSNLDQLKVLLDALPDYFPEDEQPSYVLAIPCRPIVAGLNAMMPGLPYLAQINWASLLTHAATEPLPGVYPNVCPPCP